MTLDVRLIAAVGPNGEIGLDGRLPWYDREDLAYFRGITACGILIVGSQTYRSLAPEVRGGSYNRVVHMWSRSEPPLEVLTQLAKQHPGRTIWIAGGARTYAAFMPWVRRSFITHVSYQGPADAWMPPLWGAMAEKAETEGKP